MIIYIRTLPSIPSLLSQFQHGFTVLGCYQLGWRSWFITSIGSTVIPVVRFRREYLPEYILACSVGLFVFNLHITEEELRF